MRIGATAVKKLLICGTSDEIAPVLWKMKLGGWDTEQTVDPSTGVIVLKATKQAVQEIDEKELNRILA